MFMRRDFLDGSEEEDFSEEENEGPAPLLKAQGNYEWSQQFSNVAGTQV